MSVYNEYSRLNEVILGFYNKRALPQSISNKYQMELEELHKVLVDHGVKVHRLEAIEPPLELARETIRRRV